jgi:conjugative relaxase-like TrwC/TraI family protein
VQSTHKISGDDAQGFADYLTSDSARGDYYLDGGDPDGNGAAGTWHASARALAALGLSVEETVKRDELLALMNGRSPSDGSQIRRVGGDGTRVAGIDLTFSPPKSVSALWAACSGEQREMILSAHRDAVASALRRIERDVELLRTRRDGVLSWERAESLVAAQFVHTASRLTRGQERDGVPDPQLHSHVLVLAGQRTDGRFAAVESRELFRSARVNGAWYRAVLAENLKALGLQIEQGTGKDARYFELAGVPKDLAERWSERSTAIDRAALDFRKRYGRDPKGAELRSLTLSTRGTKTALAPDRVEQAWKAIAQEHDLSERQAGRLFAAHPLLPARRGLEQDEQQLAATILERAIRERSTISDRDLHAIAYEQAAGVCHPADAKRLLGDLERSGELIPLQGGVWTTRTLRDRELKTIQTVKARTSECSAPVSERALKASEREVRDHLGAPLSSEQREALRTITGPGAVSVLTGQAGTGKGIVLRAATGAWQQEDYEVIGTAIAGAAAERLGADANIPRSMTADKLIRDCETGRLKLDRKTVVIFDEAGMADSTRLPRLTELTRHSKSKLLLAGDDSQLSPIGPGGLFGEIGKTVPKAELTEIRRARQQWERDAWREVRDGNAIRALAAYQAHDRLHLADTREQAAERMLADWGRARHNSAQGRTVMLTDASNRELDRLNSRAQEHRERAGELGARRARLPERPYDLAPGDQIIFTKPHYQPGQQRVENGTLATVKQIHDEHTLTISTRGPKPREIEIDTRHFDDLRLAYAQHVYKAQGLTADQALVLTGGWQTDRERAYVALTRAREQTHIYTSLEDLSHQHLDTNHIDRLARVIAESNAQQASITRQTLTLEHERDPIGISL